MIAAATSTGRLFLTVFACGFGLNVVAGDQYIALVLPSRIFRAEFARRGLAPTNLSRLAADSGTVTSPLVPWNSCGAFMGATLGVSTLALPAVRHLLLRKSGSERPVRLHRVPHREGRPHQRSDRGDSMSTDVETAEGTTPGVVAKMTLPTLTAMVVGGMVGAGVFSLPARFGVATGILGSLIAWAIAGTGMLMLAFVFQNLAIRKPELDSGVFIYAKAGFGDYAGFNSAIGFWASSVAGNTFYWVFISATLGAFFDSFGDGDTVLAVGRCRPSGVWMFHYLIARGCPRRRGHQPDRHRSSRSSRSWSSSSCCSSTSTPASSPTTGRPTGYGDLGNLNEQVRNTMLITTFVFIGIEGASVYSRYAKRREDVGKATVLGFLSVLSIFALVTLSSYSVVPQPELADTRQPSMVGVFESVVGDWGEVFISVAVIVSVLGAYLAWTLMAAEVMYIPARNDDFPEFLGQENENGTPITALVVTSLARAGAARAHAVRQRRAELHARPVHQPGAAARTCSRRRTRSSSA